MSMKRYISKAVFLSVFVLSACLTAERSQTEHPEPAIESIFTDLSAVSCKEFIDQTDPNSTPFQICPGVSGYTLIIRHVGSGRQSINIVTPSQHEFPLEYHEFITRHMFHLDDKAEWRVLMNNEKKIPIALIVRVQTHENLDEPEQVTHSYLALTKITPDEICVTDKIPSGSLSQAEVHSAADSAWEKDCLEPQPHLIIDGVIVR
jgi:hypothetical protein